MTLLGVLVICFACLKRKDASRLLAPRVKKADVQNVENFFSTVSAKEDKQLSNLALKTVTEDEEDDLMLNPVYRAKMQLEKKNAAPKKQNLRSGALRRLRLSVAAQNQDLLRKQNRANLTATQFEAEHGGDE